ncbi:hypothetical protein [Metabacillus iocasae]|uniref:Lycopene cyclase domain-containing protein n=1 Tax=Priestia iocasae TaxID=2291674 RepID=A0ABS2QR86_9BACI|nr:hypothetical protein [Metabacillus iocasae]MBM7701961.1 hypothetical protein [Metabacillus iocasae]
MVAKVALFITFFLPWLTLFFASKTTIKRYMPVTIFTCLLMTIVFQIAYHYKWWIIHTYIIPWGYMIDISFAYGIFAVGTFWIFRLTSHRFLLYTIVNILMDTFMCFIALPLLLGSLKIAEYKNITPLQYFFVLYGISIIIYFYHKWQDSLYIQTH